MNDNNKVPPHIQRLRAMEERLTRETKEGEMRLQNSVDYAKRNGIRILGNEAVEKVSEQNAFVGRLMAKAFGGGDNNSDPRRSLSEGHQFLTRDERIRPTVRNSTPRLGFRSILESLILPVVYGVVRGKVMAAGIKGTGRLLGTFLKRVRRAL